MSLPLIDYMNTIFNVVCIQTSMGYVFNKMSYDSMMFNHMLVPFLDMMQNVYHLKIKEYHKPLITQKYNIFVKYLLDHLRQMEEVKVTYEVKNENRYLVIVLPENKSSSLCI